MKYTAKQAWWSLTCGKCKAECEAEPTDVRGKPNRDIDGDVVGYFAVVPCGRCGNERRVTKSKMTPMIQAMADQFPTKNMY